MDFFTLPMSKSTSPTFLSFRISPSSSLVSAGSDPLKAKLKETFCKGAWLQVYILEHVHYHYDASIYLYIYNWFWNLVLQEVLQNSAENSYSLHKHPDAKTKDHWYLQSPLKSLKVLGAPKIFRETSIRHNLCWHHHVATWRRESSALKRLCGSPQRQPIWCPRRAVCHMQLLTYCLLSWASW